MLLQSIVQDLDRELDRLQAIRSIVAGLSQTTPAVVATLLAPQAEIVIPSEKPSPAPPQHIRRRKSPNLPRAPRLARKQAEPDRGALAKALSAAPVVISPQQLTRLAEERAKRHEGREVEATPTAPAMPAEDLDALSRSLAARWNTGLIQ